MDLLRTCCRNDAIGALTAQACEQAGLSSTCQANAHHIILWSWRWGSFTAQCPETLQKIKIKLTITIFKIGINDN